jgi:3-oxo-5-alpha-steroid 4-dehydrogenase 1
MGKTSTSSRFNIPGALGWFTMEIPGASSLLYTITSLVSQRYPATPVLYALHELPWQNKLMAAMFVAHYTYRAVLAPLVLNPSMAPIHPFVWVSAAFFQVVNGTCIGAWIGAYGPVTSAEWATRPDWQIYLGTAIWAAGLLGNIYHDDVLRDIRRKAVKKEEVAKEKGEKKERVYEIPEGGLFKLVLYAHYFCEWVEWGGFWLVGGLGCVPARVFLVNEVLTMGPRAWNGWYWYVERFGREKIGSRKAVIPWLV